jgi:crotonobetainyl-CoA:carnitine CoA-transferase CaiB-like acyl-CoA transferase
MESQQSPSSMAEPDAVGGPLAGVRVVELAAGFAAAAAGRGLADLGAEVLVIKRSSADRAKEVFWFLDGGKETLSVHEEDLGAAVAEALSDAYGVILDGSVDPSLEEVARESGVAVALRFGAEPLDPSAPAVVFHAAGQSMIDTPGGFPVAPPGHIPYYDAAMTGVFAFLATRWSTPGQPAGGPLVIRIAADDVELAHGRPDLTRAAHEGGSRERDPFLALFLRCDDGELATHVNRAYWSDWVQMIGKPELDDDPRFASMADLLDHQVEAVEELEKWCGQRTRQEVERLCQGRGLPAGSVLGPGEVAADPQLVHRRFTDASGRAAFLPFILADGRRWAAEGRPAGSELCSEPELLGSTRP